MSSTNRGYNRHKSDYYVTPVDKIHEFLDEFKRVEPGVFDGETIFLDPCAGGDEYHSMSYPRALEEQGIPSERVVTIDIREDALAEFTGDYLEDSSPVTPDVVITNPPFILAREFIEKSLAEVVDGGFVIMLVRLNFFGSKTRRDMWAKQLPKYSFVHSRRMSFTDDGKSDSIEYQHLVWQKGHYPEHTQLRVVG